MFLFSPALILIVLKKLIFNSVNNSVNFYIVAKEDSKGSRNDGQMHKVSNKLVIMIIFNNYLTI